jgi:hypothetical protein
MISDKWKKCGESFLAARVRSGHGSYCSLDAKGHGLALFRFFKAMA